MSVRDRFLAVVRQVLRGLPRAIGLLSAVVLLYVGYAHVAAIRARQYDLASYTESFDSERALDRFTVVDGAGLRHELREGALHVSGTSSSRTPTWIVGPVMRLEDVVKASVGYVCPANADVVVGFERGDDPAGGADSRRLLFASRGEGTHATYAIEGDHDAFGARRVLTTSSALPEEAPKDSETAPEEPPCGVMSLQLVSYLNQAIATAGAKHAATAWVAWPMGTRVRLVVGVIPRHADAPVDVAIRRAGYEQSPRPQAVTPFTDRFRAKYIDPRRWSAVVSDHADVTYEETPEGLHIHARSRDHAGFQAAFGLVTAPTPLRSFRYRGQWDVRTLKDGAVLISVLGAGYSQRRFIDAGFIRNAEGKLSAIGTGHIDGNGLVGFRAGRVSDARDAITIGYDAGSRHVEGHIGVFDKYMDGTFDLLPGELVQLRMLVNLHAADSEADVIVRELAYE